MRFSSVLDDGETMLSKAETLLKEARGRLRAGDYGEALAKLDQVLDMRPEWPEAYTLRGEIKAASGDTDGSIQDYSRALGLSTTPSVTALKMRGIAFCKRGFHLLAEGDFTQALEMVQDSELYYLRGRSRFCLGRFEEALSDAVTALDLSPRLLAAYQLKSYANFALGNTEQAVKDCLEWKKLQKIRAKRP